ncbi:zinc finger BED domain-containing protein 4-like [Pseudorasbora parva]|uniref:zinc finger BED domain-containing protein 4-like n=1 Tax=Pseudorasbora parva TaxID=51549 RepID=UPI00351F78A9
MELTRHVQVMRQVNSKYIRQQGAGVREFACKFLIEVHHLYLNETEKAEVFNLCLDMPLSPMEVERMGTPDFWEFVEQLDSSPSRTRGWIAPVVPVPVAPVPVAQAPVVSKRRRRRKAPSVPVLVVPAPVVPVPVVPVPADRMPMVPVPADRVPVVPIPVDLLAPFPLCVRDNFIEIFEMESCLLDCFEFAERHTADNLADNLLRIAKEWNINDQIVACVTDNAHNITLAIHKTSWKHLPCFAHTVNLIVRSGLSVIQNTLNKVKAIVEYMHRSTVAAEKLKATQHQMGLPELKLKQDCPTHAKRWNSTFYMLQRFLCNKDAIITVLALVNARLETPTQDEWKEMEEVCEVLKPFEEVTVEISGESYVTGSKVILLSRSLQKISTRYLRSGGFRKPIMETYLETMNKDMATRFHKVEFHHLLSEASALDPRLKKRAFSDDHAANEAFQRLKTATGRVRLSSSAHQTEQQNTAAAPLPPPQETQESLVWGDFDEQVAGLVTRSSSSTEALLEIRSYSEEPLLARSSNPLLWWQNRSLIYPKLTQVMLERLCLVATSVPSERVFSKVGQIISDRRSRISPSKARQLMFLNANLK